MLRPILCVLALASVTPAETRLLRFPDVHGDAVVFCYGGDLWTAPIATDGAGVAKFADLPTGKTSGYAAVTDWQGMHIGTEPFSMPEDQGARAEIRALGRTSDPSVITIGEDTPGREEHNTKEMRGQRQVLLHKRYFIEINQQGGGPEVYNEWYGLVKKDSLPVE